jgi:hypothetical protein
MSEKSAQENISSKKDEVMKQVKLLHNEGFRDL